jgi:ribosomal protein S8
MNYNLSSFFNLYKNAVRKKKKMVVIRYTRHNYALAQFLQKNGFLAGFSSQKQSKKQTLSLFFRYNHKKQAAIMDFSLASKTAKPNNEVFSRGTTTTTGCVNFIINMTHTQRDYVKLLSRFR